MKASEDLVRETVSFAAAYKVVQPLYETMDALLAVIDQETALIREGRLREARTLEQQKAELAARYTAATKTIKESHGATPFAQDVVDELNKKHDLFRALLKINLTVLATAHAVSEGIVRGVSEEFTRRSAPQTYGASGRPNLPPARLSQPIAVSRVL